MDHNDAYLRLEIKSHCGNLHREVQSRHTCDTGAFRRSLPYPLGISLCSFFSILKHLLTIWKNDTWPDNTPSRLGCFTDSNPWLTARLRGYLGLGTNSMSAFAIPTEHRSLHIIEICVPHWFLVHCLESDLQLLRSLCQQRRLHLVPEISDNIWGNQEMEDKVLSRVKVTSMLSCDSHALCHCCIGVTLGPESRLSASTIRISS